MGEWLKINKFQKWLQNAKCPKRMSIPSFWGNVGLKKCYPFWIWASKVTKVETNRQDEKTKS